MDSRLAYLRLVATNGIGAISAKKLLTHFGNILALFEAGANAVAETSVIPLSKVEELFSKENLKTAEDTLLFCQKNSIQILVFEDTRYPPLLKEIDSPPPVLFVKGDTSVLSTPQIAIVGTRKPTRYGMRVAEEFAYNLSALGLVVTSGLALGTDTAAHRGALKAKRPTVAVLATGCDRIYPPENNTLASEILKHNGALVSELLPQTAPRRQNFAFRNRIISGLSLGVLVVEAPQDSGALLTASHALKQNREIFAIPARIDDISSLGTLRLIQQGAKLVLSPKDILEELPPFSALAETMLPVSSNLQQERLNGYDEEEKKVVEALSAGELDSSTIARLTKIPVQQVTAILLKLQLKGRVAALPGNRFELKTHH